MSSLGNKEIMARNIQKYMDMHGKSRNDMCNALGIKYTTFAEWVTGKAYPRIDKIEMMANYFGINKSDLVEDDAHTSEPTESNKLHCLLSLILDMTDKQLSQLIDYARFILQK